MKRFYKQVTLSKETPFEILLDGKAIKTPAKNVISVSKLCMAQALREEWDNVEESIDADKMPLTQLISTALDKIKNTENDIIEQMLAYVDGDTLLYPTIDEVDLYKRQETEWLPLIAKMNDIIGHTYELQTSLIAAGQSDEIKNYWLKYLNTLSLHKLNAFQIAVSLTGSPIATYLFCEQEIDVETFFDVTFLEELYQADLWGTAPSTKDEHDKKKKELEALKFYLAHV